jgi:transcriptional regulator
MYLPAPFAEHDPVVLLAFMRDHPFATLVTSDQGDPHVGHLPLLATRDATGGVTLHGHLASANPQTTHQGPALAIFHGPHAYISANWYDAGNVVPTWNYQVVHVHGELATSTHAQDLGEVLDRLAAEFDGADAARWQQRLDAETRRRLTGQITAVTLRVSRIVGKWKLGQNHAPERRARTVAALRDLGGDERLELATAMERTLAADGGGRT